MTTHALPAPEKCVLILLEKRSLLKATVRTLCENLVYAAYLNKDENGSWVYVPSDRSLGIVFSWLLGPADENQPQLIKQTNATLEAIDPAYGIPLTDKQKSAFSPDIVKTHAFGVESYNIAKDRLIKLSPENRVFVLSHNVLTDTTSKSVLNWFDNLLHETVDIIRADSSH